MVPTPEYPASLRRKCTYFFTPLKVDVHCYSYNALLLKTTLKRNLFANSKVHKILLLLYLRTAIEKCVCRSAEYQQKRDKERRGGVGIRLPEMPNFVERPDFGP